MEPAGVVALQRYITALEPSITQSTVMISSRHFVDPMPRWNLSHWLPDQQLECHPIAAPDIDVEQNVIFGSLAEFADFPSFGNYEILFYAKLTIDHLKTI